MCEPAYFRARFCIRWQPPAYFRARFCFESFFFLCASEKYMNESASRKVLSVAGSQIEPSQRERLRAEYREAFGKWATQVHKVRQMSELDAAGAHQQVTSAWKSYRCARNRFADHLL